MNDSLYFSWDKKFWLIETKQNSAALIKAFSKYFDYYKQNKDLLSASGDMQKYFDKDEALEVEEYLTKLISKKFIEHDIPLKLNGNQSYLEKDKHRSVMLGSRWMIKYQEGGWQSLHQHQKYENDNQVLISCVMYFNAAGPKLKDGCFVSIFPEKDGTIKWEEISPTPGTIVIMSGNVVHGAYPTSTDRNIIVMDFIAEKIKNES